MPSPTLLRSGLLAATVVVAAGSAAAQPMEVDLLDTVAGCGPGASAAVAIGETSVGALPLAVGYRFTVGLEGFWLAKGLSACLSSLGSGFHGHELSLRSDDGGVPGDLLYAFDLELFAEPTLVSATATVRPAKLAFGASYWIVAEPDFQRGLWWLPTPTAGDALQAQRVGDDPWQTSVQPMPQVRLLALPEPTEPALAAFAALGAIAATRGARLTPSS